MKIHYYKYSDDGGVTWFMGKPSFNKYELIEFVENQPYLFEIFTVETVNPEKWMPWDIEETRSQNREINKIIRTINFHSEQRKPKTIETTPKSLDSL